MPTITVHTPFRLTLTDGAAPVPFGRGAHEVDEEIAQHWYVRAHTEPLASAAAEPLTSASSGAAATEGAGEGTASNASAPPKKRK